MFNDGMQESTFSPRPSALDRAAAREHSVGLPECLGHGGSGLGQWEEEKRLDSVGSEGEIK